ncbi:MAG: hypothetical protein SAJ72_19240 [Jaaginema sp. PMC 1080.18]|nr:hypothetical protein [Jaaginema sp. PMC 1080.18]
MRASTPPLLTLWKKLRKTGFSLTLEDYQQLLKATEAGFGVESPEKLCQTCQILWAKSPQEQEILTEQFQQIWSRSIQIVRKPQVKLTQPQPETATTAASSTTPPDTETNITPPPAPEIPATAAPEIPPAIARLSPPEPIGTSRFRVCSVSYRPATLKQMQQSWYQVSSTLREGRATEIDIDATLASIAEKGMLFDLIFTPPKQQKLNLLLLLDSLGSMMPFQSLSYQLQHTAAQAGRFNKIDTYYFHNTPIQQLFTDVELNESQTLAQVYGSLAREYTVTLIFSDAGAARGRYDRKRLKTTQQFLQSLKSYCRQTVWLNPMPQKRWFPSTAAKIAETVAMFECSFFACQNAIDILQTHPQR